MASLAAESPLSSDVGSRHNLPPLIETFPSDKYPIREIGGGFTAQSVRGVEADACAETAAEMMTEARTMSVSNVSSDNGSMGPMVEGEFFPVPELPRPEDATQVRSSCLGVPACASSVLVWLGVLGAACAPHFGYASQGVCHPAKSFVAHCDRTKHW